MDRRDREAILGEWGERETTAREQAQLALLDQDLEGSPLRGKRLPGRLRNFRPAVDRYVVSLGGPASVHGAAAADRAGDGGT
jgi:hypothetical protein